MAQKKTKIFRVSKYPQPPYEAPAGLKWSITSAKFKKTYRTAPEIAYIPVYVRPVKTRRGRVLRRGYYRYKKVIVARGRKFTRRVYLKIWLLQPDKKIKLSWVDFESYPYPKSSDYRHKIMYSVIAKYAPINVYHTDSYGNTITFPNASYIELNTLCINKEKRLPGGKIVFYSLWYYSKIYSAQTTTGYKIVLNRSRYYEPGSNFGSRQLAEYIKDIKIPEIIRNMKQSGADINFIKFIGWAGMTSGEYKRAFTKAEMKSIKKFFRSEKKKRIEIE
jgi:hypothetical protein